MCLYACDYHVFSLTAYVCVFVCACCVWGSVTEHTLLCVCLCVSECVCVCAYERVCVLCVYVFLGVVLYCISASGDICVCCVCASESVIL